jgi:hypothetical protein
VSFTSLFKLLLLSYNNENVWNAIFLALIRYSPFGWYMIILLKPWLPVTYDKLFLKLSKLLKHLVWGSLMLNYLWLIFLTVFSTYDPLPTSNTIASWPMSSL